MWLIIIFLESCIHISIYTTQPILYECLCAVLSLEECISLSLASCFTLCNLCLCVIFFSFIRTACNADKNVILIQMSMEKKKKHPTQTFDSSLCSCAQIALIFHMLNSLFFYSSSSKLCASDEIIHYSM